jgi:dihydroorotate dehydrogenase (NAD+) catalytic subunit
MPDTQPLPRYDPSQTYRWNYDHAPEVPEGIEVPGIGGKWTYCGLSVPSPLGIAAGPLLNGRWILYYAALGFDILTYKTVRSRMRECYPPPNLQPVAAPSLDNSKQALQVIDVMQGSWAISFGMPSMSPDVWRADIERTRCQLPKEKILSVSVVATPEPDWSLDQLAADFALCARWAMESGADCVETNFSCPNVSSADGQLYQQPAAAALVAEQVRTAIGPRPYLIKIGYFDDSSRCAELLAAVAPFVDALAMTNCISAKVERLKGERLFDDQPRGIGGEAIRTASAAQVRFFSERIRERGYSTKIIGGGGISTAAHVKQYLAAEAEAVQLATAVMLEPEAGLRIRREMMNDTD